MACSIRLNDKIQGIKIKNEEVKLSLFADDMTCFLRNKSSYQHLSCSLACFSKFPGLKLNEEKTEFFRLGVHNLCEEFPLSLSSLFKFWVCILITMSCLGKRQILKRR